MSTPQFFDNLPVADELAGMGIYSPGLKSYTPVETEALRAEVKRLKDRESDIQAYRGKHGLHLTEIQAKILGAISDEKIAQASLRDLTNAYKVLKDKELVTDGKPTEIKGFVGFLLEIEQEEREEKEKEIVLSKGAVTEVDLDG